MVGLDWDWLSTPQSQALITKQIYVLQRNKWQGIRQRQGVEDEEEGEGSKVDGTGVFSWRDKGLPLDREETDMTHRQMSL